MNLLKKSAKHVVSQHYLDRSVELCLDLWRLRKTVKPVFFLKMQELIDEPGLERKGSKGNSARLLIASNVEIYVASAKSVGDSDVL